MQLLCADTRLHPSFLAFSVLALWLCPGSDASTVAAAEPPVVIAAGADWVPLEGELDIVAGSALDFSSLGLTDAPAGKHGYVVARSDGQFAFADSPKTARRFYGVNFCFGSMFLSHSESDRIADRLARLGYNAFRIHHYERDLTEGQTPSTSLNPQKLEQFDYLMAALIRHGIYLTTDLFVSRAIPYREVGIERDGNIPMDTFKVLVPVHEGAFENWKRFSRAFLGHTNAYTGRRYADEPALAWIAMINEGNFGNFFKEIQTIPEWSQAWNRWLGRQYATREGLGAAWGSELKENEDFGTVSLPGKLSDTGLRARDCIRFLANTEREMVVKMKSFLREELGCHALVSNASSWTRFTTDQGARQVYDYVDDHFYVDHPQFLEGSWRLPSRCPNTSPVAGGAAGGRSVAFTRLFDKPFTITEYNYSGPGRFRGVGGILTGAMGALQGWGGIWRFAYSHSSRNLSEPSPMGYFDMVTDPLSQAAERASLCLFLRGDLRSAPHSASLVMTEGDLGQPAARIPTLAPNWHWLAWVTRIGSRVVQTPRTPLPDSLVVPVGWRDAASSYRGRNILPLDPYNIENEQLIGALEEREVFRLCGPPKPAEKVFRSETGEITIDGRRDVLLLDTARTAGGYAPAGQRLLALDGRLSIRVLDSGASVWVSALDRNPIRRSERLLVTHLTDLQNTDIRYAEGERRTLLSWGRMPYLMRAGKAVIDVPLNRPGRYRVWALSPGGRRLAEVEATVKAGALEFTADVSGDPAAGARMLYEIATK